MEVTGITAEKAEEIENASVTEGAINASGQLVLKTRGGTEMNAGQVVPTFRQQHVYTPENAGSGATWTKHPNAQRVRIILVGGGAGGLRVGSGGGGALIDITVPASYLNATETVTVGAGGPGGAGDQVGNLIEDHRGHNTSFTMKDRILTAEGGWPVFGQPGLAKLNGNLLYESRSFMHGNALLETEDPEYFNNGGGGCGQSTTDANNPDNAQWKAKAGYFGFTPAGIQGPSPACYGSDGSITEGFAGGGGAMSTDTNPGHGGFPGGGGARGNVNISDAPGGNGGNGGACIITYFEPDL